jgi:hypothetical protein
MKEEECMATKTDQDLRKIKTVTSSDLVERKPLPVAGVSVEQERAMAEVQGAIVLAKRFPRDQMDAIEKIKVACQRPGLADQALYSYARGGTDITGATIRLAEEIARNWGNLQYGIRELEQREGESTVEAFAWDMETNVRVTRQFQVKHVRYANKRTSELVDPRDIYELTANMGARRLRACILENIPGDVVDGAVEQCEATLKADADLSATALKGMVEKFALQKVSQAQIEKRIQRRLDAITAAQVISLRKIFNSIKDGMSKPEDWFPPIEEAPTSPAAGATGATGGPPPVEYAPGLCPDRPDELVPQTKIVCDACAHRQGCPTWDEAEKK